MPTWRTTLGRGLFPGKIPTIGQARDLPLSVPLLQAHPLSNSMAIVSPVPPFRIDLTLAPPLVARNNLADFHPPGPISILPAQAAQAAEPGPSTSGQPIFGQRKTGQEPLTNETLLEQWAADPAPRTAPAPWEWILPLVEPPAVAPVPAPQLRGHRLRPYQVDGVRQILLGRSVLLADDLGLGKTVQACSAVYALTQRGLVHRALILCSPTTIRHWIAHLDAWAPSLLSSVIRGTPKERGTRWEAQSHVYLSDHAGFADDVEREFLDEAARSFDIIVLDDLAGARREGERVWQALDKLRAPRRVALTGGPPGTADFWLSVFGFLFPQPEAGNTGTGLMATGPQASPVSILRRTKTDVREQLPPRAHLELWVDLEDKQREAYSRTMAEERRRLAGLGDAVSASHLQNAIDRLAHAASYGPISADGAKTHLLTEIVEDLAAAGLKVVVHVRDQGERQAALYRVLDRFGAICIDHFEGGEPQAQALLRFRGDEVLHVLLSGIGETADLPPMPEVSYIVHFDPHVDPAVRLRAEEALRPPPDSGPPLTVYELWSASTIESRMHNLVERQSPPSPAGRVGPFELSREDWLIRIIEIDKAASVSGAPLQLDTDDQAQSEVLPDKKLVSGMDPAELTDAVADFIHAMGFPEIEQLFGDTDDVIDMLAWREIEGRIERVLVRCLADEGNLGIAEARQTLDLLDLYPDISRAYLVGTGDFSPAAKKSAEEAEGRLELISGSELARHIRLLGSRGANRGDQVG